MNRNTYPPKGSLSREIVTLYGKMTVGAAGVVSSQSCLGFSVSKTAGETGRYTVALEDPFYAFRGAMVTVEGDTDAALTAFFGAVRNVDVSKDGRTLDVQMVDGAGADADPADGDVVHFELTFQNAEDY